MNTLVRIYIVWLIITFILVGIILPRYVPDNYQNITAHLITLGFVLISLVSRFYVRYTEGRLTVFFVMLLLLSITAFLTLITGVYYWIPRYFSYTPEETEEFTNIFLVTFTATLVFINLYEQEYNESFYKAGEVISDVTGTMISGGKRKVKR